MAGLTLQGQDAEYFIMEQAVTGYNLWIRKDIWSAAKIGDPPARLCCHQRTRRYVRIQLHLPETVEPFGSHIAQVECRYAPRSA